MAVATPGEPETPVSPRTGGAVAVALGILSSRLIGLVREQALARFFGVGPHADVFRAAMRAPNVLQNLLGEGTLSAAFIPIYSRMLDEGRREEAGRFAGAIFGLLLAAAATLSLLGVLLAEPIVAVLAAGFLKDRGGAVDRYELTVQAVRIIFPMTGILVLSAWALGVLNSHRRFLLAYFAPVLWNAAIISALLWVGGLRDAETFSLAALERLLFAACWGAFAGGLLQFLVQLPTVAREMRGFRFSLSTRVPGVRQALAAFAPVVAGRGVVQLASYLDILLASLLVEGAVSALGYGQVLYTLPISLFGMSVAAAELPEMARLRREGGSVAGELLPRVRRSMRQIAFLNVPTLAGFLAFGFLLVGALFRFRSGRFDVEANWLVYLVLCGYTVGLVPTTTSRLLQNTFYALGDTRSPARIAVARVVLAAALGYPLMRWLDDIPVAAVAGTIEGDRLRLGAVGLALASGLASWLELLLLRRALARSVPGPLVPWRELGRMTLLAAAAALPAALVWWALPPVHVAIQALAVVGTYALGYLVLARLTGAEELELWLGRLGRRLRR